MTYRIKVFLAGSWVTALGDLTIFEAWTEAQAFNRFIIEEERKPS